MPLLLLAAGGVWALSRRRGAWAPALAAVVGLVPLASRADTIAVEILDPNLEVTAVLSAGITQPIGIVFLGASPNDYFVLEKASGQVKWVQGGVLQAAPVLDLAVNAHSERGLLAMALHPNFPGTPWVYRRWTESSTGADTNVVSQVAFLGNRVDRYIWNGTNLVFDQNIVRLRARQTDNVVVPGHPGTAAPIRGWRTRWPTTCCATRSSRAPKARRS